MLPAIAHLQPFIYAVHGLLILGNDSQSTSQDTKPNMALWIYYTPFKAWYYMLHLLVALPICDFVNKLPNTFDIIINDFDDSPMPTLIYQFWNLALLRAWTNNHFWLVFLPPFEFSLSPFFGNDLASCVTNSMIHV